MIAFYDYGTKILSLSHNTFGIDVSAARFLEYASVDELHRLIDSGQVTSPYLHIGEAVTCCLLKITKVLFYTRVSKE